MVVSKSDTSRMTDCNCPFQYCCSLYASIHWYNIPSFKSFFQHDNALCIKAQVMTTCLHEYENEFNVFNGLHSHWLWIQLNTLIMWQNGKFIASKLAVFRSKGALPSISIVFLIKCSVRVCKIVSKDLKLLNYSFIICHVSDLKVSMVISSPPSGDVRGANRITSARFHSGPLR